MQLIPQNQDTARARAFFEQKIAFTTGPHGIEPGD